MRHFSLAMLLALNLLTPGAAQPSMKNVLFLGVDDLRIELGCYGHQHMQTPNIDALAKQGMLFEQAYCQQAICAASRASLMTGLRPDTTGIYDLNHPLNATLPDAMSMPRFFQEHGYRTVSLGKIYHHASDDAAYWDVLDRCSRETYVAFETIALIQEKKAKAKARGLKNQQYRAAIKGPAYESAEVPDNRFSDGHMTDLAIEQLRRKSDQPFFMAVGFYKPHLPFVAPQKYWDLYDRSQIQVPSRESPLDAPAQAFTNWGELRSYEGIPERGDCSDEETRTLIHGYRACVSYIDAQIGRLLEELDRQGLRDSTIIVLWGDHGWKLGEYGDWCKHTNFELDTHVPLIFSGPGIPQAARSAALVEYIDIYPTLAQWCGLPVPQACEGLSLLPAFSDPAQELRPFALSQYPRGGGMGYSIRSGAYRYTQWYDKRGNITSSELYDHSRSDVAAANLVGRPEFNETQRELQSLLDGIKPSPKR